MISSVRRPVAAQQGLIRFLPIGLALICIQVDLFALTLALPRIATGMHVLTTELQWLVSGYLLSFGALLIPAGRLGDVVGRRRAMVAGVFVFGAMSVVCAVAGTVWLLVAARVVQGAGAALIWPAAFALISHSTTESERSRVTGMMLGIAGAGTALGPLVGGVLAGTIGWRFVFWVNVPIAVLTLWFARGLNESRSEDKARSLDGFDWGGVVTVVTGIGLLSYGLDRVDSAGIASLAAAVPLLGGVTFLVAFALNELRVDDPLVRPDLVRQRRYLVLLVGCLAGNVGSNVFLFSATIDLQDVRHVSATHAGLVLVVASVGIAASGPAASRFSTARVEGVLAVACIAAGGFLFGLGHLPRLAVYVLALGLCGLLCNLASALAQIGVQVTVPPARSAEASSVLLTAMIATGGLSVVVAAGLIDGDGRSVPTSASLATALTAAAVLLVAAGLAIAAAGRRSVRMPASSPNRTSPG